MKPTPRRSTRQTRSQRELVEEDTIDDDDADEILIVDRVFKKDKDESSDDTIPRSAHIEAEDSGGGFLPDAISEVTYENAGGFFPDVAKDGAEESGGGFIPEWTPPLELHTDKSLREHDVEDFGGGFIPDDDAVDAEPVGIIERSELEVEDEEIEGGGFIPEEDDAMDVEPHRADNQGQLEAEGEDVEGGGFIPEDNDDIANVQSLAEGKKIKDDKQMSLDNAAADDENDDQESLLSHDPEDEDAEPEWLN